MLKLFGKKTKKKQKNKFFFVHSPDWDTLSSHEYVVIVTVVSLASSFI